MPLVGEHDSHLYPFTTSIGYRVARGFPVSGASCREMVLLRVGKMKTCMKGPRLMKDEWPVVKGMYVQVVKLYRVGYI